MRNYVFIKNRQAQDLIEDILDKQTTSTVEVSKNSKGKVVTFHNSYWVHRIRDYVENERNLVAFDLVVVAMSEQEKDDARKLLRSLNRIAKELAVMSHEFRIRGDYQTN
jgi:hypothetical protein